MQTASGQIDFSHPQIPAEGLFFPRFDRVITTSSLSEVKPALQAVSQAALAGNHVLGYVTYEAAPAFDPALQTHPSLSSWPLLWFGVLDNPLPADEPFQIESSIPGNWTREWDEAEYLSRFRSVMDALERGDTYQVNLTFRLKGKPPVNPDEEYRRLRKAQKSSYCGMLRVGEQYVLSASPELFFQIDDNRIRTRPMKGTRPRGKTQEEDLQFSAELQNSEKERAENLMIVDLLRNDIGRISRIGSVRVPELMTCEQYPTVWQMTSTVEGKLKDDVGLADVFAALFPCGSVTGAPKIKTMQIIRSLETSPRGVYCGAFGIVFPGGDCVFNVPIRTMYFDACEAAYRIGSGIVLDSKGDEEYEECMVKSRILTADVNPFYLLETIRWDAREGYYLLDEHIDRLLRSAAYFGIPLQEAFLRSRLDETASSWTQPMRTRLTVSSDSMIAVEAEILEPLPEDLYVKLASKPISSSNPYLYHKTTRREVYEQFDSEKNDVFDVLLYNEKGELTESTIANIVVQLDGVWYSPPISSGLLPGTMRSFLIKTGKLRERVIMAEDLLRAERIMLLNSVRGLIEVEWLSERGTETRQECNTAG